MYCHFAAARRNGRPHWGQFNKMQALDTVMLYGDSLNSWREGLLALQRLTNSNDSIFSNNFTRQRGLEPAGIARDVTIRIDIDAAAKMSTIWPRAEERFQPAMAWQ
jgi:hypothetical protein